MASIYDFSATTAQGKTVSLADYKDKVLLIVNTASKCGFTPQYEGLEKLNKNHAASGLVVLGFPCNQFGGQEPGTEEQIVSFCSLNYGVTFPLMAKVDVNGAARHPLFAFLTETAPGLLGSEAIKWNFTKFLVSRDGKTIKRYAPTDSPASMEADIKALLG
jgi:glutathione peroxidase